MKRMKKTIFITATLWVLSLAGSGCQEIEPPTKNAGGGVVESYYKPLPGKQVARIVYRSDFTRTFEFEYDALGRISKTTCITQSSNDKTTTEEHEYVYKSDRVVVDNRYNCLLNEYGCITEIEEGSAKMTFAYDGLLYNVSYVTPNSKEIFALSWSNNSITEVTGGMGCQLIYGTEYENRTNLDLAAMISNICYVFETWINGGARPPFGVFGFYDDRKHGRALLPTSEIYRNEVQTWYRYEFLEEGCPSTIYSSGTKDATYTFEYVE